MGGDRGFKNMQKNYTLLISSSDKKATFKEFRISQRRLKGGLWVLGVCLLLVVAGAVDYFGSFVYGLKYRQYQQENQHLKTHLRGMQAQMHKLYSRMNQIEDFSNKIKTSFGLKNQGSVWAIGPLSKGSSLLASPSFSGEHTAGPAHPHPHRHGFSDSQRGGKAPSLSKGQQENFFSSSPGGEDTLVVYMDHLKDKAARLQEDVTGILEQLYEKRDIINSTPGLVPVRGGWVSSHFGYRTYPFTGEVSLHEGIDIAAAYGSPVYAPAAGVVIFAGYKPGYGKVIILDHGYDLLTLYGHLSDIMVSPWQKIQREDVIGAVGSTGQSSGPHLHYEIRIAGVPVDPRNYILEEL